MKKVCLLVLLIFIQKITLLSGDIALYQTSETVSINKINLLAIYNLNYSYNYSIFSTSILAKKYSVANSSYYGPQISLAINTPIFVSGSLGYVVGKKNAPFYNIYVSLPLISGFDFSGPVAQSYLATPYYRCMIFDKEVYHEFCAKVYFDGLSYVTGK